MKNEDYSDYGLEGFLKHRRICGGCKWFNQKNNAMNNQCESPNCAGSVQFVLRFNTNENGCCNYYEEKIPGELSFWDALSYYPWSKLTSKYTKGIGRSKEQAKKNKAKYDKYVLDCAKEDLEQNKKKAIELKNRIKNFKKELEER